MARHYDLTLLLDPEAPEERRNAILGNIQQAIDAGGSMIGVHDWGQRKMTFEIDHRPEAEYHLFQFEANDNGLLERLDHNLKITDGVLRFRIIKLKPGAPPPPTPTATTGTERGVRDRDDRDERRGGGGRRDARVSARSAADAG
jgi:small subunit ribosomal protein S6